MSLIAVMLGASNAILEEDRSVNDSRFKIEQNEKEENKDKFW